MSKICLLLMCLPWLACIVCHSSLTIFSFFYDLTHLGAGFCLMVGFTFFSSPLFLLPPPAIPLCYSCYNDSILLGLFRPVVYSFPQWLSMAINPPTHGLLCPFCFSFGHPWPICFLWASLAPLLTLHSHGLLLTLLGFPDPITLFSSLGFMGLPLIPYFFCLYYFGPTVAHSHFSISYTTHGYAISFFLSFFKPICLLKTHFFILWACDSLFLPLGPNGFAICLPTFYCPCCWAFFLYLDSQK